MSMRPLLVALLLLVSCAPATTARRPLPRFGFWDALAQLRVEEALAAAATEAEKEFGVALKSLLAGDVERAETTFDRLRLTAPDSLIRNGSRVLYTAALQYQEKWSRLAALRSSAPPVAGERGDRASVEAWASAFTTVPAKLVSFRGQSIEIPMQVSAVGTPLIPVRVGERVYHFWLDTGSSMTMLASDVARDLGIPPLIFDTLEIVTSTGRVAAHPAVIPRLRIGSVEVRNAPTMVVEESLMRMRELRQLHPGPQLKIDGIIGFDIVRLIDIEVDYREFVVHLRNPAHSRRPRERNLFWVGLPIVELTSFDGQPLHFGLDTGAQLTFVTETLLDKLQLEPARVESRKVGGLGGEISLRAPVLPDLRVLVRGAPILFRGAVVRAPVYQVLAALDGVLGGDIWSSGIIRIDMTNGVFGVRQH